MKERKVMSFKDDLKGVNTKKAKAQFKNRKKMQDDHLEAKFGPIRTMEQDAAARLDDYSLLNWILTLHNFSNMSREEGLRETEKIMMVHILMLEEKTRKMAEALGKEKMMLLKINRHALYPSEYCRAGLLEVQAEAIRRREVNRY